MIVQYKPLSSTAHATLLPGWRVACLLLVLAVPAYGQTRTYSFPTGDNSWTTYTPDTDTRTFGTDNGDGTQTTITLPSDDDDGPGDGEEDE